MQPAATVNCAVKVTAQATGVNGAVRAKLYRPARMKNGTVLSVLPNRAELRKDPYHTAEPYRNKCHHYDRAHQHGRLYSRIFQTASTVLSSSLESNARKEKRTKRNPHFLGGPRTFPEVPHSRVARNPLSAASIMGDGLPPLSISFVSAETVRRQ